MKTKNKITRSLLMWTLVLALLLSACNAAPPNEEENSLQRFNGHFLGVFDTLTQFVGYAASKEEFSRLSEDLQEDLTQYHRLFDIYHEYEGLVNLKTLNDHAGRGPLAVDARMIDLLLASQEMAAQSHGRVNIAMGAVLRLWHEARRQGMERPDEAFLPDQAALEEASRHCRIEDLLIDEKRGTVELRDPKMSLDVGAIAKGYAVEQSIRRARERGVKHLLLSVGGNVRALGDRGDGRPWRIEIENPLGKDKKGLALLDISDLSVVTSGIYERYYRVAGRSYHHIIDPETLYPENRFLSVTVVCESSTLADALSTALFNLSLEEGQQLISSFERCYALWDLPDGSLVGSPGFDDLTVLSA